MDEWTLLAWQVEGAREQVAAVSAWLDGGPPVAGATLDETLRARVDADFMLIVEREGKALARLARDVEKKKASLGGCWARLNESRKSCHDLFSEVLAFLQGSLVRASGVDNGLCAIADALLDDIADRARLNWRGFTILAEGEFFYEMAGIIRLRFPETTVWNLPIAAHEFGHFVSGELREARVGGKPRFPFLEFLEQEAEPRSERERHLHEYFGDLFAVYVLGPAYAYSCILQRFQPTMADTFTHPGNAKRVEFILRALEVVGEVGGESPYVGVLPPLRRAWEKSVTVAALDQATKQQLTDWLHRLVVILQRNLVDDVRYQGWTRAKALASRLLTASPADLLQDEVTMADLLNAGWRQRVEEWDKSEAINDRLLDLCSALAERKQGTTLQGG